MFGAAFGSVQMSLHLPDFSGQRIKVGDYGHPRPSLGVPGLVSRSALQGQHLPIAVRDGKCTLVQPRLHRCTVLGHDRAGNQGHGRNQWLRFCNRGRFPTRFLELTLPGMLFRPDSFEIPRLFRL